jgi:hypothetical protein
MIADVSRTTYVTEGGREDMMRKPRPWWVTTTGTVNVAILAAVILFIVWATFFR